MRAEDDWYKAWEDISRHARTQAVRAKGNGDGAAVRAWQKVARIAASNRDAILVARAIKSGRL